MHGVFLSPGHIALMKKYYKSLSWSSYDLPKVLEERGVFDANKLPGFHYRDDALRLWQAIGDFIKDILSVYYHSDHDIQMASIVFVLHPSVPLRLKKKVLGNALYIPVFFLYVIRLKPWTYSSFIYLLAFFLKPHANISTLNTKQF